MRKGRALFATVAVAGVVTAGGMAVAGATPASGGVRMNAVMDGASEVPGPGDPDGSGKILLNVRKDEVCYSHLGLRKIDTPMAMHIHTGGAGAAGGVVVNLTPMLSGTACVPGDPEVLAAIRAMPSMYYVNVHNGAYPAGAVRGQLQFKTTT